jgi:hypothetical protein
MLVLSDGASRVFHLSKHNRCEVTINDAGSAPSPTMWSGHHDAVHAGQVIPDRIASTEGWPNGTQMEREVRARRTPQRSSTHPGPDESGHKNESDLLAAYQAGLRHGVPGSIRSTVLTRSMDRSNEATRPTPVLSAHATK